MFDKALDDYTVSLKGNELDVLKIYNNRFRSYMELGRFEEAINDLKIILKKKPDEFIFHLNMGICYIQTGENKKAIIALRKALKLNPDFERTKAELRALGVDSF